MVPGCHWQLNAGAHRPTWNLQTSTRLRCARAAALRYFGRGETSRLLDGRRFHEEGPRRVLKLRSSIMLATEPTESARLASFTTAPRCSSNLLVRNFRLRRWFSHTRMARLSSELTTKTRSRGSRLGDKKMRPGTRGGAKGGSVGLEDIHTWRHAHGELSF